jgi:hypothetical protein
MKNQEESFQIRDYPISKVVDCLSGNSGLTEQVIYQNICVEGERYLVLSSSTEEETKLGEIPICEVKDKPLKVFENREGILVVRNGKAGTTFFLEKGKYAITDHAYILALKNACPYEVSLKWLMVQYRWRFLEYSSSSDNGTWNMTGFFDEVNIDIPIFEKQMQLVQIYERMERLSEKTRAIRHLIRFIKEKQIGYPFVDYQGKDVSISEVLSCMSGNSGLTEEYLYSQIQTASEKTYRILTGSTDFDIPEYTHKCEHPKNATRFISVIEGKPVIHVVRKGKAGSTAYFEKGNYTINDDAYLLFLKDSLQKTLLSSQKSYQVNLKWLLLELKSRFYDYSSSSDNGTWNKTRFFDEVKVDIPSYAEQNQVVAVYDKMENLENTINDLSAKIEDLLKKQVAQD